MRTSALLALAACSGPSPAPPPTAPPTPAPGAVEDGPYDAMRLLADLQSAGIDADVSTEHGRPLSGTVSAGGACQLPGVVTLLGIRSESVTVYELPDPDAANAAAARVSCDGDVIDGCILEWMSEPHYFVRGRIVVEHVGSPMVATALAHALGAPFAGEGAHCQTQLAIEATHATEQIARGEVGTIRGIARDAKGRAEDLLVVRVYREGWSTTARTGWTPYGAPRKRGELVVAGVPAGRHTVDVSRWGDNKVAWTREIDVTTGETVDLDVRIR